MDEKETVELYYTSKPVNAGLDVQLILYVNRGKDKDQDDKSASGGDSIQLEKEARSILFNNFEKVNFPVEGGKVYDRVIIDYKRHYFFYEGRIPKGTLRLFLDKFKPLNQIKVTQRDNLEDIVTPQPFNLEGKWYIERKSKLTEKSKS